MWPASRRRASSSRRSSSSSRTTSATCATSSSPSSRASCACCRPASASAPPPPRSHIAIEMEKEGLISKEEAVMRVDPEQLDQLLHPQFDKNAEYDVLARGLNASPGAAVGEAVFSAADAVGRRRGRPQVRARPLGDQPRRPGRHDRRRGHPDQPWRQDLPCCRYRPRHGRTVRVRRRGPQDRR